MPDVAVGRTSSISCLRDLLWRHSGSLNTSQRREHDDSTTCELLVVLRSLFLCVRRVVDSVPEMPVSRPRAALLVPFCAAICVIVAYSW